MSETDDIGTLYVAQAQDRGTRELLQFLQSKQPQQAQPAWPTEQPQQAQQPQQDQGSLFGRAARDIGTGFVESAPAVVGGINDAVRNAIGSLNDLGNWLNTNVADLSLPGTGISWLDNPVEALQRALPEPVKGQESVTGNFIRGTARFLTGFGPAMKALKAAGLSPAMASILGGGVAGATVQDPAEGNMANFIQQYPMLQNPITDFLATNKDDPGAVNRLKNAIEAAGFGAMTEGVLRGVKAFGKWQDVRAHAQAQPAAAATQPFSPGGVMDMRPMELSPEQLAQVVPKKTAPLVKVARKIAGMPDSKAPTAQALADAADDALKTGMLPVAGEKDIFVNLNRIEGPNDIKMTINEMAQAFKGSIKTAQRDVKTWADTTKLADDIGMTVPELLARKAGDAWNAEHTTAARKLLYTSAENLTNLATKAAAPNAGQVDQFLFQRAMSLHYAIQNEVYGMRTEVARALNAWKIPVGGGQQTAAAIKEMMDTMGRNTSDLAMMIAALKENKVPVGALNLAVQRGWGATSADMIREAYTLGLLWRPTTHLRNLISNTAALFQMVYERGAAARIGRFLGTAADDSVADGEAMIGMYGMLMSTRDAFRNAGKALLTGQQSAIGNKLDIRPGAISSLRVAYARGMNTAEAIKFAETGPGKFIDVLGAATRGPGNMLAATDDFFKTLVYGFEVHAQALRRATQEGLTGPALYQRVAQLAANPDQTMRMAASDAALYATFNNRAGRFAQTIMDARNSGSLNPTFVVMPFVRTPANLFRYTFERTPLAPLVGQWRADIAAGGVRRDLALARIATGSAILSVAMDYAVNGFITGPGPGKSKKALGETWRGTGWQPFSIKIGDKFFSYSGTDPVTMPFAFAGAVADLATRRELAPRDFDTMSELTAHMIGAIGAAALDKSYLYGLAAAVNAVEDTQRGPGAFQRYIDKQSGSLIPFSSLLRTGKLVADPQYREINSFFEGMMANIAGLSDMLPPSRDLFGDEIGMPGVLGGWPGRAYDVVSPLMLSQLKDHPVFQEMKRLNLGISRIQYRTTIEGVPMNLRDKNYPEVFDYYVRLAGNELKMPGTEGRGPDGKGLGLKDYLTDVVTGKDPDVSVTYATMNDFQKTKFIQDTVGRYRRMAVRQLLAEAPKRFPEFYQEWNAEQAKLFQTKVQGYGIETPQAPEYPMIQPPAPPRQPGILERHGFAVPGGNQ